MRLLTLKEWTWSEYAEMVKFTKTPIHTSLLKLQNSELTQLAVNCFIGKYNSQLVYALILANNQ